MTEPQSMDTAPKGVEIELLYDFPQPKGLQWVPAIYKNDRFWGKNVDGWWHPDSGMWIDGWIKAWRPKKENENDRRIHNYKDAVALS